MMSNAELAARLLREAAQFYRNLAGDDAATAETMIEFGRLYDRVADLIETDPTGSVTATAVAE